MMKSKITVLICLFLLVGTVGVSFGNTTEPTMGTKNLEWAINSFQDHMTQARDLEQEIERLTQKVSKMKREVDTYNQKPYLDTKGVRRNGLKILIGKNLKEIASMREQVAWHREEASKLAGRENASEEMAENQQHIFTEFGTKFGPHPRNGNSS